MQYGPSEGRPRGRGGIRFFFGVWLAAAAAALDLFLSLFFSHAI